MIHNLNCIVNKIISILKKWNHRRFYIKEMNRLENKVQKFCLDNNIPLIPNKEYIEIQNFWEPYINYKVKPYYYSILTQFSHIYPIYQGISEAIMYNCIIRKLNPIEAAKILANKGMYASLFNDINRPCELLRDCNGLLLDRNNQIVTIDEGIKLLLSYNKPFIIKPTIDTHGGRNVKIISQYNENNIISLMNDYQKNFVIQEVVQQSAQTKKFNPTSLNTFRVVTLFLNGKISVLSCILRCGGKGAIVDNASFGGMFVGINQQTGKLTRASSYKQLEINESPSGLKFQDCQIEHLDKVLNFAKQLHIKIPLCALAGWDIALNENNEPVFIEVNLNKPEVWLMQVCNGPIFGERFEEVLEYCFK